MTTFRSQRLETLLGTKITQDDLKWEHLERLKAAQVREAADLDYKRLYGTQPSDRHKPGGDVAAMANTQGGLIIIGADEDGDAQLKDLPGLTLSDKEHTRLLGLIGDHVHPYADFEIIPVPDPDRDGIGCYVIAVPRSPRYPHGVLINNGFRYPRRNGHQTMYMSEPEIASAYRARFSLANDQITRIAEIEKTARNRFATYGGAWVTVSLVPNLPGDMIVNWDTFGSFKNDFQSTDPVVLSRGGNTWQRIVPGPRCLILDTEVESWAPGSDSVKGVTAQLYTDGSGVFGMHVPDVNDQDQERRPCRVDEKWLIVAVLSGLRLLAGYARDYAYAGGDALLRVRVGDSEPLSVELGTTGPWGSVRLGEFSRPVALAERAAPLDGLAAAGTSFVATAAYLVGDILRAFGHPDVLHITTEGRVAPSRWGPHQEAIASWAKASDIETI
ncbi:ATP-binding protein [Nonomuraea sp. NPDC003709]|uniref:AlbA family DNA-binding domain-containing protein n=1 Tax=Nonomuraea sp. NPDC003709 TaxID=3154450 RepID=UPI0033ACCBE2